MSFSPRTITIIHSFSNLVFYFKNTQNDKQKKNHLVNLNNLIWTYQCDWVINLDLVILISRMIDKMIDYLLNT